mgnify:CR=1 FL=1
MSAPRNTILCGDALARLRELPDACVQTCVTSPPYFGLRDYGHDGQIGLEATPEEYVASLVAVFREVRRVLRDDGTLWCNLGDSYAGSGRGAWDVDEATKDAAGVKETYRPRIAPVGNTAREAAVTKGAGESRCPLGLKPKDLMFMPHRVAMALQADGWWARSTVIWHKPNPMPESVTDRPTKSHEYLFLLSKSARYFYDADAIKEPAIHAGKVVTNDNGKNGQMGQYGATRGGFLRDGGVTVSENRNKRDVWTIPTQPCPEARFAVMPEALVEPCVLAGSRPGDVVLDPFFGAGTVGLVALRLDRDFVGIELNPAYVEIAERRLAPLRAQGRLFA